MSIRSFHLTKPLVTARAGHSSRPPSLPLKPTLGGAGIAVLFTVSSNLGVAKRAEDLTQQKIFRSRTRKKVKDKMEQALVAVQLVFYLMGGLGLFFLGVGVLSFVDVYKKKSA